MNRRQFLGTAATATAAATIAPRRALADAVIRGKAEHVIMIWLGGGMGAIDTFDPKRKGDPAGKKAGAYYDSVETSVPGVRVCEHLARTAPLMDRVTVVRSLHHDVIDEHAAAANRMHTGRPVSGTVVYPSIGSMIAHERGAAADGAPPYVVIGYPNVTRGPGFLGARHGYLYLTDTTQGPAGLARPEHVGADRFRRRDALLTTLRASGPTDADPGVHDYAEALDRSLKLSGPEFLSAFHVDDEPADLRASYGGEFGRRCLLARRLTERGVRFIEVSHNLNFLNGAGWDVHNGGILQQHALIRELDSALAALIVDLETRRRLDSTLIVVATEFGRPPEFDGGGGRGHQGTAFSCVLAGGGLSHRGAFGATDDLARKIVADPVSVADFFATMQAAAGVDYTKSLYDGDRPVPMTDGGRPIAALFA